MIGMTANNGANRNDLLKRITPIATTKGTPIGPLDNKTRVEIANVNRSKRLILSEFDDGKYSINNSAITPERVQLAAGQSNVWNAPAKVANQKGTTTVKIGEVRKYLNARITPVNQTKDTPISRYGK